MGIVTWPSGLEWLAVIPMLGVLIFVHELGHFLAAVWMKIRVEEFGFGYPPRMLTLFERKGVKYTLNWLPFGGFVRMSGEEGNFEDPDSIQAKKPWQRLIVFCAGPFMNFLLAAIIYIALYAGGLPEAVGPVLVQEVSPQSPAATAGVLPGDIILKIGDKQVRSLTEVATVTASYLGKEITMNIQRNGQEMTLPLRPRTRQETPANQGPLGVTITLSEIEDVIIVPVGFGQAVVLGFQRVFTILGAMTEGLGQMVASIFTKSVPAPEGGVAGPIGIARLTGEIVRSGWQPFLDLTAFLSLNFALLNILPLPALDGGHIVFAVLEWLRRGKRVPPEREALVHLAGMAVLIALMLVISYLDIARWLRGDSILPGG